MNRITRCPLSLLRSAALVAMVSGVPACEDQVPDPNAAAARSIVGPAGTGGDPAAAEVWQAALVAWPREGSLAILYGSPVVQGQMDAWMMGQVPPAPLPEAGAPTMAKVRAFNDRLIALDGAWGPLPDPESVRAMAVRDVRRTLWSDARLAVAEEDEERLVDVLVVMATLPRVSHVYDATVQGIVSTIGLVDAFSWALRDAGTPRYDIVLTETQCERVRRAAAWMMEEGAFGTAGPDDPRRQKVLETFETESVARVREMLDRICSASAAGGA